MKEQIEAHKKVLIVRSPVSVVYTNYAHPQPMTYMGGQIEDHKTVLTERSPISVMYLKFRLIPSPLST